MTSASRFESPDEGPRWVLLDANVLVLPFTTGFPLLSAVREAVEGADIRVARSTVGELRRVAERGGSGAVEGLRLARSLPILETRLKGDDAIVRLAVRHRAWVVTLDRKLRGRLRQAGIGVLVPRGTQRLQQLGPRRHPIGRGERGEFSATVKTRPRLRSRASRSS